MHRTIRALFTAALVLVGTAGAVVVGASSASAQDYGPDTCLQGYVWREATIGDHVCVTPATRTQARNDNAQAAARRNPAGGPYGPDTCLQGYVWREATAGDHVCVTPATRIQASDDNARSADRQAALNIWITYWHPAPVCNGDTCTSTSTDDLPHIKINGDHFNINSRVWLGYYRLDNHQRISGSWVTATPHTGFPGGSFGHQTNTISCGPGTPDSYIRAYDQTSDRWSARLNVHIACAIL